MSCSSPLPDGGSVSPDYDIFSVRRLGQDSCACLTGQAPCCHELRLNSAFCDPASARGSEAPHHAPRHPPERSAEGRLQSHRGWPSVGYLYTSPLLPKTLGQLTSDRSLLLTQGPWPRPHHAGASASSLDPQPERRQRRTCPRQGWPWARWTPGMWHSVYFAVLRWPEAAAGC